MISDGYLARLAATVLCLLVFGLSIGFVVNRAAINHTSQHVAEVQARLCEASRYTREQINISRRYLRALIGQAVPLVPPVNCQELLDGKADR